MPANLFHIDPADKSMYFLSQIFGSVGNVLPGAPSAFMNSLFLTINTIALTVGAIVVVYTTVVGLMMTAHEGEFLGKKWSGLWVPIRMVAGVVSLFPAASGYSTLQVIIMWIIVQGVGAANTLWTAAVVASGQGTPTVSVASNNMIGVSTAMKSLFQGLVCEATFNMNPTGVVNDTEIKLAHDDVASNPFNVNSTTYLLGKAGACGTLTKCSQSESCPSGQEQSQGCALCKTQNEVLQSQIIPQLRSIAQKVAQADSEYLAFYYTANQTTRGNPGPPASGWITEYCKKQNFNVAEKNATCCVPPAEPQFPIQYCMQLPPRIFPTPYQKTGQVSPGMNPDANGELSWAEQWALFPMLTGQSAPVDITAINNTSGINFITINSQVYVSALLTAAAANAPPPKSNTFDTQLAINSGWITAGIYFYNIVNAVTQESTKDIKKFSVSQPGNEVMENTYRNNYTAAGQFLTDISGSSTASSPTSAYDSVLNDFSGSLTASFMQMLQGAAASHLGIHDTPLLRVATFGQNLLIIAQLFYVVIMASAALFAAVAAFPTTMFGGFGNITGAIEIFKAVNSLLMPALYLLLGALMTMGALLGMYVPMIPFVVFTASVIGWFIAVIEAMVAAPIIALGIMSPGGQSEVFGRAEPSLMIIFNLFLRPTLMVFGLLVASFLANVVIKFICMGFIYVKWNVMTLLPGLVEEVIFIGIFASVVFTSMNQVFTLIHHIPERILTYIGGQPMQYGEAQAAQAMKQAVEAAAGGAAQAGKGTAEGAVKTGVGIAKKHAKEAEDKLKLNKKI